MKIVFLYSGGRAQRVGAIREKRAATEFFYGAIELAQQGHDINFLEIQKAPSSWVTVYNTLFGWMMPIRTSGDDVLAVGQLLSRLREAECIVATTTTLALAIAIWKKINWIRTPMVGIHCGLLNYPPQGIKRWMTRALLKGSPMAFFARPEAEGVRDFYNLSETIEVPFGVDTDFWSPANFEESYVLSVGNDSRRDYETLIAAAEQCALPVKILTSCSMPPALPSNVSVLRGSWKNPVLDDAELLHLYRKARLVVIPLHECIQPSGQSVALQAMACGKPVILTRTRGLWTEQKFNDNQEIVLVPERNPTILAQQMLKLWNDPAQCSRMGALARAAVLRVGDIHAFANGILECCNKAIAA